MEKSLKDLLLKTISLSDGLTFENLLDEFISYNEKEISSIIKELEDDLSIYLDNKNYFISDPESIFIGKFSAHEKGFGFVERKEHERGDLYIDSKYTMNAFHGDIVLAKVKNTKGRSDEGKILKIIERGKSRVVGTFKIEDGKSVVVPDEKKLSFKILIPENGINNAVEGHKVVVEITDYLDKKTVSGLITNVIGHINDPGVDILTVIHKHDIPYEFPEEVIEHANSIPEIVSEEEIAKRIDLRGKKIFTIDGEDAKDLDDAVYVEKLENGNYKLGVYIADVSYYVTENSPMDNEAYFRSTSVYLVDRVIPMIPHRLSNGICSLNPKVNRLVLCCEMEFDNKANLLDYSIFEGVLKTTERMTYTDVNSIISRDNEEVLSKYQEHLKDFDLMYELSQMLRKDRESKGAIDFDINESKIFVDENCKPTEIVERVRGEAEKLIEDFMLAANDTVAMHLTKNKLPGIFRIHDQPRPSKLYLFSNFINNLGYQFKGDLEHVKPIQLQNVLNKVKGSSEETVISKLMLRSMSQAKYSKENLGHFGLAKEFYTHFTSPIRRYPDLMLHRLIRKFVLNKEDPATLKFNLEEISERTSHCERRAIDAERETQELKKAEYMLPKVGEEFEGIISSVTKFGLFVALPDTVEGLVHISNLTDDRYEFDEEKLILVGKNTSNIFSLGDPLNIKVTKVSVEERKIYFEIVGMGKDNHSKNKKSFKQKSEKKSRFKERFNKIYK